MSNRVERACQDVTASRERVDRMDIRLPIELMDSIDAADPIEPIDPVK